MIVAFFLLGVAAFALAFFLYGSRLEANFGISDQNTTPANSLRDNVDYVPTPSPILFGHHFSSIAGAGPIVGPIIAALAFGVGPVFLWIVIGSIFVGGVHDFGSLIASVRHRGRSIGEICRDLLNPLSYKVFLWFIWLTMVYVLVVFLDLTANTFAPLLPAEIQQTPEGLQQMRIGGTVATASLIYIVLALVFGITVYRWGVKVRTASLIFIPLVFAGLVVGHYFPLSPSLLPSFLGSVKNTWALLLLFYCLIAATIPVWLLLQPRDYLSSFLLYACLLAGGVGLLIAGAKGEVQLAYPVFVTWSDPQLRFLYPALFVTVACGAVSGFHSLVASGTTAKQLDKERDARTVAYGGMLVEGTLALIALSTVAILQEKPAGLTPVAIFSRGIGHMLSVLHVPRSLATAFGMLALSTFLLTTLDTCTRLARFVLEEILHLRGSSGRLVATIVSLLLPALLVFRQIPGPGGKPMPAWQAIWPAFGVTNQLLAALAMLVVFLWLRKEGKRFIFVLVPLLFMATTTLTALTLLVREHLLGPGSKVVGGLSLILEILAILLFTSALVHQVRYSSSTGQAAKPST